MENTTKRGFEGDELGTKTERQIFKSQQIETKQKDTKLWVHRERVNKLFINNISTTMI